MIRPRNREDPFDKVGHEDNERGFGSGNDHGFPRREMRSGQSVRLCSKADGLETELTVGPGSRREKGVKRGQH
jgi:hypothetical protein